MLPTASFLDLYQQTPLATRLHVNVRWRLFDFAALAQHVPEEGPLVDLGCGHGLWTFYLAQLRPGVQVLGIDPDRAKIELAQNIARQNGITNTGFEVGLAGSTQLPECSLICLIDMLYLIPYDEQQHILSDVAQRLKPRGRILLKEMNKRPRWKYLWNWLEETVAVRALRITYGQHLYFRHQTEWESLLQNLGLLTRSIPLDAGRIHPHILFIGQKP